MGTGLTVGACLCWYAEPPESLEQCLASLTGVVDFVVALDGPWDPYPAHTIRSTVAEWRTVGAAPLPIVYGPVRRWASQIEKRTAGLQIATQAGADWILVIDADEHIRTADLDRLRHRLSTTGWSVATIHSHRVGQKPRVVRRLYRALPGLAYEKAHSGVRTVDRRWLSGDTGYVTVQPAEDLTRVLSIFHEQGVTRPPARQADDATFQRLRLERRLESWSS